MEPESPTTQTKHSHRIVLGLLFVAIIVTALFFSFHIWQGNRALEPFTVLNIGDGAGLMGRPILTAAARLRSTERPLRIVFKGEDRKTRGLIVVCPKEECGCPSRIQIAYDKLMVDDEVLTAEELRERLLLYSEMARLTDSTPLFYLYSDDAVTGEQLIAVLKLMDECEIHHVILPNPTRVNLTDNPPPSPPQITPLPYKVYLK